MVATHGSPSTLKTPTPSYPGMPSLLVLSFGAHFSKTWTSGCSVERFVEGNRESEG